MSRTRHAAEDAPLSQERYMSSPEYADLRGLSGSAVAAKVAILADPRARSLLLFLDALSRRPGGLKKVAADFLAAFPERIGTPSMHKFGVRGKIYTAAQVRVVRQEVERLTSEEFYREALNRPDSDSAPEGRAYGGGFPLKGELEPEVTEFRMLYDYDYPVREKREAAQKHPTSYPAEVFVQACQRRLSVDDLERFLVDLCINPALGLTSNGRIEVRVGSTPDPDRDNAMFYFHDIIGALHEFKARHEQAARANFAETAISKIVFRTLDRGRRARTIAGVCGVEGIGKSDSAEAWCEQHLGEARYVLLRGTENQTTFYGKVWVACGLGSPVNRKVSELKLRVEKYLEDTRCMLVIDEAHRLLPQSQRIYTQPELLNWLYTLEDLHIPVAIAVTPQFLTLLDEVERQTHYRSGQVKRRIDPWVNLPEALGEADLRAVARSMRPNYTDRMIDELVDFALPARRQLNAMKRAIEAAEFIAEEQGRTAPTAPTLRDLLAGIEEAQQTELALTTPLDRERQAGRRNGRAPRRRAAAAELPQPLGDTAAEPLPLERGHPDFADRESAPPIETHHARPRAARPVSVVA